jgi:hypothetical protein
VIGLQPAEVAKAWGVELAQATAILGGDAGALGVALAAPPQTARPDTTLDEVAQDAAGIARLAQTRSRFLANAATRQKDR